jgi:hypothetical protein
MGLDDFFEQGHKRQQHGHGHDHDYGHEREHDYGHERDYRHNNDFRPHDTHKSLFGYGNQSDIKQLLSDKLQSNPQLKSLFIIGAIIVLIIVILFAVLLFPLLLKLMNFTTENGVQGLVDAVWKGVK